MKTTARNTFKVIDTKALCHNIKVLQNKFKPAKFLAMVKADAYGHGIFAVVPSIKELVDGFGVAFLNEAIDVKTALDSYDKKIVIMEGVFDEFEWRTALENGFDTVIHHEHQLDFAIHLSPKNPKDTTIWLKYNTGMNRLGFDDNSIINACNRLTSIGYRVILTSHFACSDDKNSPINSVQIDKFNRVLNTLQKSSNIGTSLCNSAGVINFTACHYDWVRVGIAMYGASPVMHASADTLDLKPVMSFRSQLIAIHKISQGQTVGYGGTWTAQKDTTIGVVAVGYGDGYPRVIESGVVLINGKTIPIIGRVAMDMMVVDISDSDCALFDTVTLWGADTLGNILPIETVAKTANTISYELFCKVSNRPITLIC